MDLEEQIRLHKELSKQINDLEEKKKVLGGQILQQMTTKILQVPGYVVKQYSRLSYSISVDEARQYGAVKLEETVDKAKLKTLHQEGQRIQGVNEINYIQISELST